VYAQSYVPGQTGGGPAHQSPYHNNTGEGPADAEPYRPGGGGPAFSEPYKPGGKLPPPSNQQPSNQQVPTIPQQVYNQSLGLYSAPSWDQPAPPLSGRKKALLVGINYFGTQAELKGCINDVHRMRGILCGMYGFPSSPDSMLVLTDDSSDPQLRPTRANIMGALQWLAQGVQPGDVLFFHFSGHGAQQEDPSYSEEDGYDETICPGDFNTAGMIVDDEIFDLMVGPLPAGAKLTAVMDCCHSGTGLDLPFTLQGGGWCEEDNPCHSSGDVLLISGCQDEQCSSDGGGGMGPPMGAMTTALCNTLERSPVMTHSQLLDMLRGELRSGGFQQIPSLTSSQRFDAMNKPFNPCDNIEGNHNPQLGRQFRKKKHPKNQMLLNGGLGQMLMAGAAGFLVGDLLMGGDITSGLVMGGADLLTGGGASAMAEGPGFMAADTGADAMGAGDVGGGYVPPDYVPPDYMPPDYVPPDTGGADYGGFGGGNYGGGDFGGGGEDFGGGGGGDDFGGGGDFFGGGGDDFGGGDEDW